MRGLKHVPTAGGLALLVLLAGCGGGGARPVAGARVTGTPVPATGSPGAGGSSAGGSGAGSSGAGSSDTDTAGLLPTPGTAYTVGIPASPTFVEGSPETRPDGTRVRRWTSRQTPDGPACTIVASEQPGYTGSFPEGALQIFKALRDPGDEVLANEAVTPPAGATSAVRQESRFTARMPDGTSVPAHLHQRQVLTAGHTLLSVAVAGPETDVARCRLADVAASLQPTGKELRSPTSSATGALPALRRQVR